MALAAQNQSRAYSEENFSGPHKWRRMNAVEHWACVMALLSHHALLSRSSGL